MWHIRTLTYESVFAGSTVLTSYGIGSGGYHNSWPLDAEAVNLIANMIADYPKHIAYIDRTVNTKGIPGHGKPVDQMIEHYNL